MLERGDLVLVPFPYSDMTSTKVRPALVVSSTNYNRASDDVVVCAVTSNLEDAAFSILLRPGDMATGELRQVSRVKASRIMTMHQRMVRKKVGRVKPAVLSLLARELAALLPLPT